MAMVFIGCLPSGAKEAFANGEDFLAWDLTVIFVIVLAWAFLGIVSKEDDQLLRSSATFVLLGLPSATFVASIAVEELSAAFVVVGIFLLGIAQVMLFIYPGERVGTSS
ncbi:MAG: hypothetical protein COT89_03190 [Candidatus Colwellbacteria bacterium CG10_big_fil_rev_8_21_14_0_10_42_22]|uniref:Uncharacterized protein n=1 Tax=Candidatus Colwellbacteria bacterium CG10_big_fil_rev_8_21_14_0_10_42_22 TaxID=1974540 RepID=A0A2H0VF55_9BACT|nr:MAG: hypothetical protein COT89_03190 [Candidatus Colwellbacteria bacterium CG10_big_fil_rev_8_21_14_0_10_42_22]